MFGNVYTFNNIIMFGVVLTLKQHHYVCSIFNFQLHNIPINVQFFKTIMLNLFEFK